LHIQQLAVNTEVKKGNQTYSGNVVTDFSYEPRDW